MAVVKTFAPEEEVKVEALTQLVVEVFINMLALLRVHQLLQTQITDRLVRSAVNQATTLYVAGIASTTVINWMISLLRSLLTA